MSKYNNSEEIEDEIQWREGMACALSIHSALSVEYKIEINEKM